MLYTFFLRFNLNLDFFDYVVILVSFVAFFMLEKPKRLLYP